MFAVRSCFLPRVLDPTRSDSRKSIRPWAGVGQVGEPARRRFGETAIVRN